MNIGVALVAFGLTIRFALKGYRVVRGGAWRHNINQNAYKVHKGGFYNEMTRRQAQLILGLLPNSNPKMVKDRHRKLMIINHPDNGGSTFIAAKINEAKELLSK